VNISSETAASGLAPALLPVAAVPVTLDNCADEPIHLPGTIQMHGAMLVFSRAGLLETWSANVFPLLSLPVHQGAAVQELPLPEAVRLMIDSFVADIVVGEPVPMVEAVTIAGREFDCVVHARGAHVIVEFESRDVSLDMIGAFALKAHGALDRLKRQGSITALLQMATEQVRQITGFDRVMGYRFSQDGSGNVVAESKIDTLDALLGLRYPASDIPAQARRLYMMNTLRLIPDMHGVPVALSGGAQTIVDMSHSVLRSVSPVHIEYLRNMGVGASMSVSIIVEGKLWGLIACHHMSARHVPYAIRMTADVIAQVLAATVQTLEARRRADMIEQAADMRMRLMQSLLLGEDTLNEVAGHAPEICAVLDCPALIVTQSGRHRVHGDIDPATVAVIVRAHPGPGDQLLERLGVGDWPVAAQAQIHAWPGMLAMCFDPSANGWIIAMRPEQVAAVRWAGKPEKIVTVGPLGARLTPRGSFEEWLETVRGRAAEWSPTHLIIARQLQEELHRASIARQGETDRARAQLMAMLGHDLRAPLHAIQMAAVVLQNGGPPVPMGLRIQTSSNRMSRLISQVLDVSKIENGVGLGMQMAPLNWTALVRDVMEEAMIGYPDTVYCPDLADGIMVAGDSDRLAQVISNLLNNARSHGAPGESIDVTMRIEGNQALFSVSNVADALTSDTVSTLYAPFKAASLNNSRNRDGMGLGLFIAERIVAGHNGTIAYTHLAGRATFTVALPFSPV
jgi:chemotaxis family two-component system sensor kinase Cph1